jgi:hypothetical protein
MAMPQLQHHQGHDHGGAGEVPGHGIIFLFESFLNCFSTLRLTKAHRKRESLQAR